MSRVKINRAASAQSVPTTIKGTHLTVITQSDGKQSFIWDWDKLLEEVQQAIGNYEKSKTALRKNSKLQDPQRKNDFKKPRT